MYDAIMTCRRATCVVLFSFLVACGGDGEGTDGGDTGADGGGPADDSGPGSDSGSSDGGPSGSDAGPPPGDACGDPGDQCIACVYGTPPATEADCTCLACPTLPATRRGCQERQTQYDRVCGDWLRRNPCPDVLCTAPPPVACVDGTCQITATM
jgi:hypothetical protein